MGIFAGKLVSRRRWNYTGRAGRTPNLLRAAKNDTNPKRKLGPNLFPRLRFGSVRKGLFQAAQSIEFPQYFRPLGGRRPFAASQ